MGTSDFPFRAWPLVVGTLAALVGCTEPSGVGLPPRESEQALEGEDVNAEVAPASGYLVKLTKQGNTDVGDLVSNVGWIRVPASDGTLVPFGISDAGWFDSRSRYAVGFGEVKPRKKKLDVQATTPVNVLRHPGWDHPTKPHNLAVLVPADSVATEGLLPEGVPIADLNADTTSSYLVSYDDKNHARKQNELTVVNFSSEALFLGARKPPLERVADLSNLVGLSGSLVYRDAKMLEATGLLTDFTPDVSCGFSFDGRASRSEAYYADRLLPLAFVGCVADRLRWEATGSPPLVYEDLRPCDPYEWVLRTINVHGVPFNRSPGFFQPHELVTRVDYVELAVALLGIDVRDANFVRVALEYLFLTTDQSSHVSFREALTGMHKTLEHRQSGLGDRLAETLRKNELPRASDDTYVKRFEALRLVYLALQIAQAADPSLQRQWGRLPPVRLPQDGPRRP